MKNDYQKHIVSGDEYQVWLHRTHTSNIDSILKEGLHYGSGDLSSTASLQQRDLASAENSYQQTHKGSNAVVVIKIPRKIADKYFKSKTGERGMGHEGYDGDKDVTYWHPKKAGFTLQRKHIHGWINKETNKYTANPYRLEHQGLTEEHFPKSFYSPLESKAEEASPYDPNKPVFAESFGTDKRRKLKRPPKNIQIIP